MKQWSGLKLEPALLRTPDLGAGQIGRQQVGSELKPLEVALHAGRKRLDGGGLGQAGRAFDQQVAAREQRDQQTVDQSGLTDDAALQPVAQLEEFAMNAGVGVAVHGLSGIDCIVHR